MQGDHHKLNAVFYRPGFGAPWNILSKFIGFSVRCQSYAALTTYYPNCRKIGKAAYRGIRVNFKCLLQNLLYPKIESVLSQNTFSTRYLYQLHTLIYCLDSLN